MKKFGNLIVKLRIPILILSVLLLIPAAIGYFNTKVNYDILYYLPGDIDTMKGQDILLDDFGKGAYAMVVVDWMNKKNVSELVKKVEKVEKKEEAKDLTKLTVAELRDLAKSKEVKGYSTMKKAELLDALK